MKIHPTAVISPEAQIAEDVEIGPFSVIVGKVSIGSGCKLENNVCIGSEHGIVEIGKNNLFSPCCIIGKPPQDITYSGQDTKLVIGDRNVFREFSTANIATTKQDRVTLIGNDNYFMTFTHIGHDCVIGNNIVIANDTDLGGHTVIGDHVKIGGKCGFNQFSRIGQHAFIAGASIVNKDILPFTKAGGHYAISRASNKIGLERAGVSAKNIEMIHKAIRIILMGKCTLREAVIRIQNECEPTEEIQFLLKFITESKRGIAK